MAAKQETADDIPAAVKNYLCYLRQAKVAKRLHARVKNLELAIVETGHMDADDFALATKLAKQLGL